MKTKIEKRVIECPKYKRAVELTCQVSGPWYNAGYEILGCPAMDDDGGSCYRECKSLLSRPSNYSIFAGLRGV